TTPLSVVCYHSIVRARPARGQGLPLHTSPHVSSFSEWVPLCLTHYAMMVRRRERRAARRRSTGPNSLKTPPLSREQGASPLLRNSRATRPENRFNMFLPA